MKNTVEALRVLLGEPELMRHAPLSGKLDALRECKALVQIRDSLRARAREVKVISPRLDSKLIWQKLQNSQYDLSSLNALEIRTLCTVDETAVHPRFVEALMKRPDALRRSLCLYGLVNAYFNRWRSMDSPEKLERVLKNAIEEYPRVAPAITRWRSTPSLFSPEAAEQLAQFIVERRSDVANVLRLQYIGAATRLAVQTGAQAAETAAKRFRASEHTSDPVTNLQYLQWMIREVLTRRLPLGAVHTPVSLLILSDSADRSDAFQQTLRAFVEGSPALGDPRLQENGPNWRDMDSQAAQRFLSWLAKEYIQFFFNTILPRNDENRRRAEFWLRYYKQIRDFQVAISEEDLWKLKKNNPVQRLPLHSRVTQTSTSAFLMQFAGYGKDYVIVEFSETGNAAYIYERAAFESTNVDLRTPYFQMNRHLKHSDRLGRIIHIGGWETSARYQLAGLGIRP